MSRLPKWRKRKRNRAPPGRRYISANGAARDGRRTILRIHAAAILTWCAGGDGEREIEVSERTGRASHHPAIARFVNHQPEHTRHEYGTASGYSCGHATVPWRTRAVLPAKYNQRSVTAPSRYHASRRTLDCGVKFSTAGAARHPVTHLPLQNRREPGRVGCPGLPRRLQDHLPS